MTTYIFFQIKLLFSRKLCTTEATKTSAIVMVTKKDHKTRATTGSSATILLFKYSVGPTPTKDIDRIENVQRRAARFIYSDYKRTSSVTAMMNELGWKPLNERRKEQRLVLLFKIVNDLVAIPT